jgi:hypothetical protein
MSESSQIPPVETFRYAGVDNEGAPVKFTLDSQNPHEALDHFLESSAAIASDERFKAHAETLGSGSHVLAGFNESGEPNATKVELMESARVKSYLSQYLGASAVEEYFKGIDELKVEKSPVSVDKISEQTIVGEESESRDGVDANERRITILADLHQATERIVHTEGVSSEEMDSELIRRVFHYPGRDSEFTNGASDLIAFGLVAGHLQTRDALSNAHQAWGARINEFVKNELNGKPTETDQDILQHVDNSVSMLMRARMEGDSSEMIVTEASRRCRAMIEHMQDPDVSEPQRQLFAAAALFASGAANTPNYRGGLSNEVIHHALEDSFKPES